MSNQNETDTEQLMRGSFPFNLVGLGGTFDHLHPGHKTLLKTAFKVGKKVAIALTTEKLLQEKEFADRLQDYETRKSNLVHYIEKTLCIDSIDYDILPLNDPFGPAIIDPRLEAHVSSMETYKMAMEINKLRRKNSLDPVFLIVIPMVLNKKGNRYSSSAI